MNLPELSIRRPVFAAMLVLGLVVLGVVSLGRLEMALEPDVEFPFVSVVTQLRGASPETVERAVSDVLEEHINSIEGVHNLSSSSSQGLSSIFIEFELGRDVDVKVQEVRDQVALARASLPLDVEDPVVQKFDLGSVSFMTIMLGGPLGLRELSDLAQRDVKERLERISGVGGVRVEGARQREIHIWLDPLRLTGYGLSIQDVADTLRRENAELASGRIEGTRREWSVTTQGKARSVAEFGEMIVAERGGRLVRLRDVAVVEDGMAEARSVARLNGQPGVAIELQRQSGADLVAAAREARQVVASIAESLPPGVHITVFRDYASIIESQIHSVFMDMLLAAALVVVVVLLFLRNFRSTFISAIAIPASILASFSFFLALDLSLNNTTLMALSLAVGLVIDDAIVVLESIFRKVEQGAEPRSAALTGSKEVALAVVSTTIAVWGVFVPITFMTSTMGRYFFEFGVAVVVAVGISTVISLTLTPMLASRWLNTRGRQGVVFRFLERGVLGLEARYRAVLQGALRHRLLTLGLAAATVAGGITVATTLPVNFFTQDDLSEARVKLKLPVGTPLAVTSQVLRRLEEAAASHPHVREVFASVGTTVRHEPNRGRLALRLLPKAERSVPIETTFEELRQRLRAAAPEAEQISVGHPDYASSSGEFSELMYSLRGPDLGRLERLATALVQRMKADPAFVDVHSSFESGRPQVTLDVDRGRAADLGVSAMALGRTLRTVLAGEKVGSYEEGGRRYDVRVRVLPEYRDDPAKLDLVRVRSASGGLVPLRNLADVRLEEGPVEIRRENRTRMIRLMANMGPGASLSDGVARLERWATEIGVRPPDTLSAGGQAESMQESMNDIAFAFGLAMLSIYMILASLFNSLIHPFTIMVSAPLSFIGGFLALKVAGMSFDIMSGIGLLVLMGLVMKNGILLVDYTNQLRSRGLSRDAAILEAGPVRMRPVLMTSGALIFGMLPLVLSTAMGSEFRAPMATITIGGLITSTALTLVVAPVVYSVFDGATQRIRQGLTGLGRRVAVFRPVPR